MLTRRSVEKVSKLMEQTPPPETPTRPAAPASCSPETCRAIHAEFRQRFHEMYNEERARMRAAMLREFPVGTRVTWDHGRLTVKGRVVFVSDWSDGDVEVRRDGTNKGSVRKKAYELTAVNSSIERT